MDEFTAKLGIYAPEGGVTPLYHPKQYKREINVGPGRLKIGIAEAPISLVRELFNPTDDQFCLLYVLKVSRHDKIAEGRYQSEWMNLPEFWELINRYRDFFEGDGRHDVWFYSAPSQTQIVYDRHEYVFYYGDLDWAEAKLKSLGYVESEAELNFPHCHYYHAKFDVDCASLLQGEWQYWPLFELDQD